jgi:hypothetical protein
MAARFPHFTSDNCGVWFDALHVPLPPGSLVLKYAELMPLRHGGMISLQLWFTDVVQLAPVQPASPPVPKSTNAAQALPEGLQVQLEQLAAAAEGSAPASNTSWSNAPSQLGALPVELRSAIGPDQSAGAASRHSASQSSGLPASSSTASQLHRDRLLPSLAQVW